MMNNKMSKMDHQIHEAQDNINRIYNANQMADQHQREVTEMSEISKVIIPVSYFIFYSSKTVT